MKSCTAFLSDASCASTCTLCTCSSECSILHADFASFENRSDAFFSAISRVIVGNALDVALCVLSLDGNFERGGRVGNWVKRMEKGEEGNTT